MNETVFEKMRTAAAVLKLDLSTEEFADYVQEQDLSEETILAVQSIFTYLSEKKQQTTVQTLLKMGRLPTREPKTFENFDFNLLKGRDEGNFNMIFPAIRTLHSGVRILMKTQRCCAHWTVSLTMLPCSSCAVRVSEERSWRPSPCRQVK